VNFWSQIAFAFTGLELVSAMSQEIRDPRKTLPRAVLGAGALITVIYILGTFAVLSMIPAGDVDPKSGVFQAITQGSTLLRIGFVGVLAAVLVSVGNAGGVGSTVAGISRVPFVVGIDCYLPAAFGKIHPRWKTPYISILVQAVASAAVLLLSQINETTRGAYQSLIDITVIIYFIPFLYMFAAAMKLAGRPDRAGNRQAVLIPGGKLGVYVTAGMAGVVTFASIIFSIIPPGDSSNKVLFEVKVIGASLASIAGGLILYWRGARNKAREAAQLITP
jgi:amino acid transporter